MPTRWKGHASNKWYSMHSVTDWATRRCMWSLTTYPGDNWGTPTISVSQYGEEKALVTAEHILHLATSAVHITRYLKVQCIVPCYTFSKPSKYSSPHTVNDFTYLPWEAQLLKVSRILFPWEKTAPMRYGSIVIVRLSTIPFCIRTTYHASNNFQAF